MKRRILFVLSGLLAVLVLLGGVSAAPVAACEPESATEGCGPNGPAVGPANVGSHAGNLVVFPHEETRYGMSGVHVQGGFIPMDGERVAPAAKEVSTELQGKACTRYGMPGFCPKGGGFLPE